MVTVESANEDFTSIWSGGSVIRLYLVGRTKAEREENVDEEVGTGGYMSCGQQVSVMMVCLMVRLTVRIAGR